VKDEPVLLLQRQVWFIPWAD